MTKFVFKLIVLSFFIGAIGNFANLQAQDHDVVADSVSIDDMDPVFITEEEEEEESSNGAMIAIVIVALAAAGVGYKFIAKKKNK